MRAAFKEQRVDDQKLKDVIKDRYGKIARGEADLLLPHLRADR